MAGAVGAAAASGAFGSHFAARRRAGAPRGAALRLASLDLALGRDRRVMSDRLRLIEEFLARAGWGDVPRRVLAADASFRRYDRLASADRVAVLMDAPPPQ